MSAHATQSGLALVDDGEAPTRRIDHEALSQAVDDLLRALGADVDADGLQETPRRVAEARGMQQPGGRTGTSALRGAIRDDHQTRQELLA